MHLPVTIFCSNNGVEKFPSEWVSLHDGHETASDDGNWTGKLLWRWHLLLRLWSIPGHRPAWSQSCSSVHQPCHQRQCSGPECDQAEWWERVRGSGDLGSQLQIQFWSQSIPSLLLPRPYSLATQVTEIYQTSLWAWFRHQRIILSEKYLINLSDPGCSLERAGRAGLRITCGLLNFTMSTAGELKKLIKTKLPPTVYQYKHRKPSFEATQYTFTSFKLNCQWNMNIDCLQSKLYLNHVLLTSVTQVHLVLRCSRHARSDGDWRCSRGQRWSVWSVPWHWSTIDLSHGKCWRCDRSTLLQGD